MKKFFIFNMFSKFIIILNLLMFSSLSIFLNDLFMIWFFMEINNFMFICLMCFKIYKKKIIFFYFIIQTMASLLLIFSLLYSSFFFLQFNYSKMMLILSLSLKLGIPPFHLWMPLISMFLNWEVLFFFLSIQKITPLYMLSLMEIKPLMFYLMVLSSSFISTFKMMMNLNFKIILTYSSINQTSWMLLLIMFKNILWLMYFIVYSIILLMISLMFQFLKLSHNFFYNIKPLHLQLMYMFMFFNMASLPPLSFFFMKWLSIYTFLFNSNMYMIFIIMLINSFILIYIYINMMTLLMFFYSLKSKMFFMINHPFKKTYFILFMSFFLSLIMILI
uniref:NADH dehydrogenase subunit 2 n=1 Tax=Camponotus japonicus TaxID=84547 RepID=UPI001EFA01A9|nr:NADH dehydrogenase subunit 2 [Camponotus japonicus]UHM24980.1 NADH dehydrogenase subunit 2 [Camponotus japonicus]